MYRLFIILLGFLFLPNPSFAQKNYEFGVIIGTGMQHMKTSYNNWKTDHPDKDLQNILLDNQNGVNFGFLYKYNLRSKLSIIPQAVINIEKGTIQYIFSDNKTENFEINPINFEIPVHLQYRMGTGFLNPTLTAGATYAKSIQSNTNFDLNKNNLSADIGLGIEFDLKLFKIQPQALYSYGLTNYNRDQISDVYHEAIDDIKRNNFQIRLLIY